MFTKAALNVSDEAGTMDCLTPRMCQVLEEEKYVTRLKEHMPEKFREMCHMHLSFILNLSDDKLERLLSDDEKSSGRRKLALVNPIFKKKDKSPGSLFGAALTYDSVRLMAPLVRILSSKDTLSKEGLFRKPGNRQRMRTLREALNEVGPGLRIDLDVYNCHDVCGVLKEFLRELPEPLLTEKHMEAHMQIAVLGSHAQTTEDCARYVQKKVSALQLLMQLVPAASSRMIMDVLVLLHAISVRPETRMTAATLATIFAPIFFLNKKVSPLDMCEVIKVVEPALAFMIENVHKMFKIPRELAVDIKNYCKSIEECDEDARSDPAKVSQTYKIRKSVSGRTLNTTVCYIDREQAKAHDSASTTQNELESLIAHIHSLPDTPSNRRYKDMVSQGSCTPGSSGKRHRRSKSIGASIKKHLPSLSRAKAKSFERASQGAGTPYRDIMPGKASVLDLLQTPGIRLSNTTRTIADSLLMFTSSPPPATKRLAHPRKRRSCDDSFSQVNDECTPPKQECKPLNNITDDKTSTTRILGTRLPLSLVSDNSLSASSSPSRIQLQAHQKTQGNAKDFTQNLVPGSENEIGYLPINPSNKNTTAHVSDLDSPLQSVTSRRPLRPCNAPGTPIMPRTLLQMAHNYSLETSI